MRISDWSSDVCSSDLFHPVIAARTGDEDALVVEGAVPPGLIVHWLPPPTDKSKKKRPKGDDVDDAIATTVAQIVRMLEHGKLRDPSSAQVGGDGMRPVGASDIAEIGRAHVGTPVTNAHLVCRLLLEKKNNTKEKRN